ncbi:MAG: hypothetical protein A2087_05255 [Spirochaetes bacterium GWD1_61_31]|nr:MAG: hypothetical protein A2Y37_10680 [Spirochaetes bacterium GWB1_60_80]OHD29784.1 MAG: hypothetical protein A2004_04955 [Spirochaetes bacterium GWC1_61_12]OHD42874.1 MAG: hypothetical protein A2Y35_13835 [Spirochaetes bacterium GWE1_60_18]OHD43451.1 MAG: hypothetical protein A2087_05255 [Spirochaetes bacterium GWD1_61_31]OHD59588.1 MAG: hypothetical protein A2Y32_12720 [Spirochaetes bacterium GWF1_60_12]HAP43735.1 hypothetical protein [Spirochaetaceae bacterium]
MKRFLLVYTALVLLFIVMLGWLASQTLALAGRVDGDIVAGAAAQADPAGSAWAEAADLVRQQYLAAATEGERLAWQAMGVALDAASAKLSEAAWRQRSQAQGLAAFTLFTALLAVLVLLSLWLFGMRALAEPLRVLSRRLEADLATGLPQPLPPRGAAEVRALYTSFNALCRDLAEYRRKVQLAERETIGRYLIHEMRNLITPIPLAVAALRRSADATALDLVDRQAGAMAALLERFRHSYRFPPMQSAPCRLGALLAGLPDMADPRVRLELPPDWPDEPVMADGRFLSQAMANLLRNALEALAGRVDGGQVWVRLAIMEGAVAIEVRDNGCGMPAEVQERLFDEWFTTKQKGMGLGLSFSRRVARGHGGELSIVSVAGEGTVCTISWPAASP